MPGHQLLGLGRQRLGLVRELGRLGLREQAADPAQCAVVAGSRGVVRARVPRSPARRRRQEGVDRVGRCAARRRAGGRSATPQQVLAARPGARRSPRRGRRPRERPARTAARSRLGRPGRGRLRRACSAIRATTSGTLPVVASRRATCTTSAGCQPRSHVSSSAVSRAWVAMPSESTEGSREANVAASPAPPRCRRVRRAAGGRRATRHSPRRACCPAVPTEARPAVDNGRRPQRHLRSWPASICSPRPPSGD